MVFLAHYKTVFRKYSCLLLQLKMAGYLPDYLVFVNRFKKLREVRFLSLFPFNDVKLRL